MIFEKNEKKFKHPKIRLNRAIPGSAEFLKLLFPYSFIKLNSLQAHIKKIIFLTMGHGWEPKPKNKINLGLD